MVSAADRNNIPFGSVALTGEKCTPCVWFSCFSTVPVWWLSPTYGTATKDSFVAT